MALVITKHADFHAKTQSIRAVFPQIGHRIECDLSILNPMPP